MSANAGEIRARLVLSNDEFKRKMNETREDMKQTGFSAEQMSADFGKVQKASMIVGGAVAAAIGGSVKVAADFEQSMAQVQAISGSTAEEFERQEKAAREMGAATIFSASEAAEGLGFLAMAGFDVNEQIDALPSVLNAAIAGNMGLGQSADIVSNIMTGFGLAAEDAEMAVDVLAQTSNTANTNIPQLGEAMKYAAPIASSLGWDITETAAAIGKMSDAGIQGGQAGTSLRAALLALANPTGQTKDAMEDLGIEVLTAEGNMKPLPELMGHVSERMEGMTDAQKTQAVAQLVGSQAASGFISLLEVGEEGLQDYTTELKNSEGAAQAMADIQSDTLNGAFKEFQSALAEAGIALGNEFLPMFREIVEWGTKIVGSFDEINVEQAKSALAFAGTAAAIGLTISTIGKLVLAVRGLMASMGPAGWLITGLSIVGGLVAANKVKTEEAVEVSLDHARSLDEESTALSNQIERYDALKEQNKLTNDELARYVDLQTLIALETDPEKVEAMQKEFDALQDKSGMTNDEMLEFLGLNDDIIEKIPNSNIYLTEQGNILLGNTDAAKAYNAQLEKELELELRRQANEASEQLSENIQKRTDALEKQNDLAEDFLKKQQEIEVQEMILAAEEMKLQSARETGNEANIKYAEERVEQEEANLGLLEDQAFELSGQIIEQEEIVNGIELQILKGQEAYDELINYRLEQVDVVAEKGKELDAIDEAISKTEKLIKEAREKHTVDGEITAEGQEQIDKYNEQIRTLGSTRTEVSKLKGDQDRLTDSIDDSLGVAQDLTYEMGTDVEKHLEQTGYNLFDAENLHTELEKPAKKEVTVWERVKRFFTGETKHGGGIVGDGKSTGVALPKLHTGGLASDLVNRPLHNEVDVRLLQNEMVLTEGQQANLFRMIKEGRNVNESRDTTDNREVESLLRELVSVTKDGKVIQIGEHEIVDVLYSPFKEKEAVDSLGRFFE